MAARSLRLQVLLAAVDRATGPFKAVLGGTRRLSEGLRESSRALKQLQEEQARLTAFSELKRKTGSSAIAMRAAQQQVNQLRAQIAQVPEPTRRMTREMGKAERTAASLRNTHRTNLEALRGARHGLTQAGIGARDFGAAERRLKTDIEATTRAMADQKHRLGALHQAHERAAALHRTGMMVAGHGAGVMYGGMRATRRLSRGLLPGMEFDSTMAGVQAMARLDKDSDELQALRTQARALGASTLFSAVEVGEGMEFLAKAGFDPSGIQASIQSMLDVALAGRMDLGRAADITTNISSGFGIDPSDTAAMEQLADTLVKAFTTSNTSLEQLGETMKYFAPIAKAAGIDLQTSAAMAGMLGNVGIQGSMAGTTLRGMTARLSSQPAAVSKALGELGVESLDENGNLRDLVDLVGEIDERFREMDYGSGERLAAMNAIFGMRGMVGMAELSEKMGTGEFQAYAGRVRDNAGTARGVAFTMADNLRGDLDQLISAAKDVGIQLYETMLPALRGLSQWSTDVIRRIGTLVQTFPRLSAAVFGTALGGSALMTVLGGLTMFGGLATMAFAQVARAVTFLTGGRGLSGLLKVARLLLIPLGGISAPVLAIGAALALVAALVWKFWGPIKAFFVGVWQGFSEGMAPVMEQLREALAPLAPLWGFLAESIAAAWGWIKQLFTPFEATTEQLENATNIGRYFGEVLAGAVGVVVGLFGGLLKFIGGALNILSGIIYRDWQRIGEGIKTALGGVWQFINTLFGGWPGKFLAWGRDMLGGLIDGIMASETLGRMMDYYRELFGGLLRYARGAFETLAGIFTGDWQRVREGVQMQLQGLWQFFNTFFGGLPDKFATWGRDMLRGLIDGITSMAGAVGDAITGAVSGAVERFKSLLGIRSPSRVFAGFGMDTLAGLAGGIQRAQPMAARAMSAVAGHIREIGAGIVIGTAAAPVAMAAPAQPAAGGDTYEIHIHAAPGADNTALVDLLRAELARIEREKAARRRSALRDFED